MDQDRGDEGSCHDGPGRGRTLDENLLESLSGDLRGLGHDVETVLSEGLVGTDEASLWNDVRPLAPPSAAATPRGSAIEYTFP